MSIVEFSMQPVHKKYLDSFFIGCMQFFTITSKIHNQFFSKEEFIIQKCISIMYQLLNNNSLVKLNFQCIPYVKYIRYSLYSFRVVFQIMSKIYSQITPQIMKEIFIIKFILIRWADFFFRKLPLDSCQMLIWATSRD